MEGVVSTPSVPEGSVPSAVKPLLDQLTSAAASLPDTLKDTLSSGLKLPLCKTPLPLDSSCPSAETCLVQEGFPLSQDALLHHVHALDLPQYTPSL